MQATMMRMAMRTPARRRWSRVLLWTLQGVLALLFLSAGGMKLLLPVEEMTKEIAFPGLFIRLIGVCEVLGALGLVLPGITRIRPELTGLAAVGLVGIMVGAVVTTIAIGGGMGALFPAVVGLLLMLVAYHRWQLWPHRLMARRTLLRPVF